MVLGALAGALAYVRLASVASVPSPRIQEALSALRRLDLEERSPWLLEKSDPRSWEGRLGRAMDEAGSDGGRVDAVSEAVHDADTLYASRSSWSRAALRLQILGGVLIAAFTMIRLDTLATVLCLVFTAIGALVIAWLGRRASELERGQRLAIDALVSLLLPDAQPAGRRREPAPRSRAGSAGSSRRGRSRLDRSSSPV